MTLTERQRAALDDYGWLVLPDVLDARALAEWQETFERAAAMAAREGGTRHVSLSVVRGSLVARKDYQRPTFDDQRAELVVDAVRYIIGRDFGLQSCGGRDPLPGFGQQGLHADWRPRAAWEPNHAATALWLLDDYTPDNGATRLVPGSHRKGAVPKSFADPERHHPGEKLVVARAGSVLVFNGHLWHSGTRNRSRASRRVLQCQYAASEYLNVRTE